MGGGEKATLVLIPIVQGKLYLSENHINLALSDQTRHLKSHVSSNSIFDVFRWGF